MGVIHYLGLISYTLYLVLTITEMVVMKTLYIFKFSKIAAMNEYFITFCLISFNVVIILINMVLRLAMKEYESNPFLGYTNDHNQRTNIHLQVLR